MYNDNKLNINTFCGKNIIGRRAYRVYRAYKKFVENGVLYIHFRTFRTKRKFADRSFYAME